MAKKVKKSKKTKRPTKITKASVDRLKKAMGKQGALTVDTTAKKAFVFMGEQHMQTPSVDHVPQQISKIHKYDEPSKGCHCGLVWSLVFITWLAVFAWAAQDTSIRSPAVPWGAYFDGLLGRE